MKTAYVFDHPHENHLIAYTKDPTGSNLPYVGKAGWAFKSEVDLDAGTYFGVDEGQKAQFNLDGLIVLETTTTEVRSSDNGRYITSAKTTAWKSQ